VSDREETTACEHEWQVESVNLRRDSTGTLFCTVCDARRADVVLSEDSTTFASG
jgi:hypothetical protein